MGTVLGLNGDQLVRIRYHPDVDEPLLVGVEGEGQRHPAVHLEDHPGSLVQIDLPEGDAVRDPTGHGQEKMRGTVWS